MTKEHRHPDTGRVDLYRGIIKYSAGLPHHLHFLTGIAILLKRIDLWQHIERYLFRIDLTHNLLPIEETGRLTRQLFNRLLASARNSLIGGYIDAFDSDRIIDWL